MERVRQAFATADGATVFVASLHLPHSAKQLEDLEVLDLSACGIPAEAGVALGQLLARCPRLAKLHLARNTRLLSAQGVAGVVAGLGDARLELEVLDVCACGIPAEAGVALGQFLARCPRLSKLDVRGNRALFSAQGVDGLVAGLGAAPFAVRTLGLHDFDITVAAAAPLAQLLARCPRLEKLNFAHNRQFWQGASLAGPSGLTHLDLRGCDIAPEQARGLGTLLAQCPQLCKVDLRGNSRLFAADALQALVAEVHLLALSDLLHDFRTHASAGGGLGQFLARCPKLTKLDLRGNSELLTGEGARALVDGLGDAQLGLTHLDLCGCGILADAGFALGKLLSRCPRLARLDLCDARLAGNHDLFSKPGLAGLLAGLGGAQLCLTRLDLCGLDIPAAAGPPLGALLAACPQLRVLGVLHNPKLFTACGLAGLLAGLHAERDTLMLASLPLSTLSLRGLAVEPGAAASLGQFLACCPKLTKLDLRGNSELLTGEGARALVDGLGDAQLGLTHLDLCGCGASAEAAAQLLARCPQLETLDWRSNAAGPLPQSFGFGIEVVL